MGHPPYFALTETIANDRDWVDVGYRLDKQANRASLFGAGMPWSYKGQDDFVYLKIGKFPVTGTIEPLARVEFDEEGRVSMAGIRAHVYRV